MSDDVSCCIHGDTCKARKRIRRRVMHHITRSLDYGEFFEGGLRSAKDVYDEHFKAVVQKALTDVLEEELS